VDLKAAGFLRSAEFNELVLPEWPQFALFRLLVIQMLVQSIYTGRLPVTNLDNFLEACLWPINEH
jgi:hypothetical protein